MTFSLELIARLLVQCLELEETQVHNNKQGSKVMMSNGFTKTTSKGSKGLHTALSLQK